MQAAYDPQNEKGFIYWRTIVTELVLAVGKTLDEVTERGRFLRTLMTRIMPIACAVVQETKDGETHAFVLPKRFPIVARWSELRHVMGEGGQNPGTAPVHCVPIANQSEQAYVWTLGPGEALVVVTSTQQAFTGPALRELSLAIGHFARVLQACREHRKVQELADLQRISNRVFELSPDAILVTDPEQRIIDVNPAFERITGYRREEVLGKTPKILASGRHDAAFYHAMWRQIHKQGYWIGEIWNRKKDGTLYPELLTIVAVTDREGVVRSYVGIFVDITEQKAREAELERLRNELKRQNQFLKAILDHLGEGVYVLDRKGQCTYFNAAATNLLGWRAEEALGKRLHELIHHHRADGTPLPEAECLIHQAFTDRHIYRSETETFWHKNGTPLPVRVVVAPLIENGQVVASVAVFDDITKQKAIENELRRAKEEAERTAKAKSEFLAVMSHEIRTPLNGVIGGIDLLLGTPLDNEQRDFAHTIRASAETLLYLINDILDFSKLEAGAVQLEKVPTDLTELVQSVIEIAQPLVKTKPVVLRSEIGEALPTVLCDPVRLRQVLLNLTSNACKFTEQGEVVLAVTEMANGQQPEQVLVRFEVRDTGIGIPPEAQSRLFEPFTQADASVTRRFGGTGLGLAIVKRLVDLMGGTIAVASAVGRGTTFTLIIPFPRMVQPKLASTQNEGVLATSADRTSQDDAFAELGDWKGQTVLVVEDNPVNQRVVSRMLERLGLTVEVADNGQTALTRCAETRFPLIFMDCQMPVMDGFTASRALRARFWAEPPPVIVALTANASEEDRNHCLAAGMDDYLPKPVTLRQLQAVLQRWAKIPKAMQHLATSGEQVATQTDRSANAVRPASEALGAFASIPLFDENRIQALFGDDPALLEEILELFLGALGKAQQRLADLLAQEPIPSVEIASLAHELLGSASNIGADQVAAFAQALSEAAKQQDRARLLELNETLPLLHEAVRTWRETKGAAR